MADEDFDLSLSPIRKSAPKQGRRADLQSGRPDQDGSSKVMFDDSLKSRPLSGELFLDDEGPGGSRPPPPMHGRRTGGWADETSRTKTAKSVRIMNKAEEMGGFGRDSSDEDDGPLIPDLDDVQDEEMTLQVADAPAVAVNRVATYKELDNDLLKHVAFATLDDIDLRLLTRCLAPEAALKEPDETWHWDQVFAGVAGELRKEWFPEDDEDVTATEEEKQIKRERPYTAFNRFPV